MRSALDVYERALSGGRQLRLVDERGWSDSLPVHVWTAEATAGDDGLLDRCRGPVLDVGCGPGRLAAALLGRGVPALGVDIAPAAVGLARARGALAMTRSVFDRLPGERRWPTVLLADGNVGIGGHPGRLVRRVARLLAPGGTLLVELGAPGSRSGPLRLRLADDVGVSGEFQWARLAVDDVDGVAAAAGLVVAERWTQARVHSSSTEPGQRRAKSGCNCGGSEQCSRLFPSFHRRSLRRSGGLLNCDGPV